MADQSLLASLDPFTYWRDVVSQVEKGVNEFANRKMKSDKFVRGMNKVVGVSMAAKKMRQDLMQRYFEALNLPSRADVLALAEKLQSIEDRLIGMAAALERLDRLDGGKGIAAIGMQGAPVVRRTRKPPAPAATMALVAPPSPSPRPSAVAVPARKKTVAARRQARS
ncbi:hypothetical protein [Variovorax sp. 770b2]|uniref:hypothetical protein n=1 Tax=Variovorax sp. 770b2 TaxID=1566271 RepID=UPI0008F16114|nr:hypothetical protein [Variovorax sp. 770b2]SFQ37249.1 hypothetical protein SAMN03159339_0114 [Variovorax sp. 770b2]